MKYRFYINVDDAASGDIAVVKTKEGKEIDYSYMCDQSDHNPPEGCGYRLVYENDEGDFQIFHPCAEDYSDMF